MKFLVSRKNFTKSRFFTKSTVILLSNSNKMVSSNSFTKPGIFTIFTVTKSGRDSAVNGLTLLNLMLRLVSFFSVFVQFIKIPWSWWSWESKIHKLLNCARDPNCFKSNYSVLLCPTAIHLRRELLLRPWATCWERYQHCVSSCIRIIFSDAFII